MSDERKRGQSGDATASGGARTYAGGVGTGPSEGGQGLADSGARYKVVTALSGLEVNA